MIEFMLKEEGFKLGLVERVPVPEAGECFLLYQEGGGSQMSYVISYGMRYSSAEIRHGHYNRKVTFSLENKSFNQSYRIVMLDIDFYFNVAIKISYNLQDVRQHFFEGRMEEDDLQRTIRDIVREQDRRWSIQQGWEIKDTLETAIERKLKQYEGIKFRIQDVTVTPDEEATKMLKSNREKTVGIHIAENETDKQIAQNKQKQRITSSEQELKSQQIMEMAFMAKNFGNLGPIVSEYLEGNIDGEKLYDYAMRARKDNLDILNTAVNNDWLTQDQVFGKLNEILGSNGLLRAEQQLPDRDMNATVETEEERDADEDISPVDGDYL